MRNTILQMKYKWGERGGCAICMFFIAKENWSTFKKFLRTTYTTKVRNILEMCSGLVLERQNPSRKWT